MNLRRYKRSQYTSRVETTTFLHWKKQQGASTHDVHCIGINGQSCYENGNAVFHIQDRVLKSPTAWGHSIRQPGGPALPGALTKLPSFLSPLQHHIQLQITQGMRRQLSIEHKQEFFLTELFKNRTNFLQKHPQPPAIEELQPRLNNLLEGNCKED